MSNVFDRFQQICRKFLIKRIKKHLTYEIGQRNLVMKRGLITIHFVFSVIDIVENHYILEDRRTANVTSMTRQSQPFQNF